MLLLIGRKSRLCLGNFSRKRPDQMLPRNHHRLVGINNTLLKEASTETLSTPVWMVMCSLENSAERSLHWRR